MGGVVTYDITDPEEPTFLDYINDRDFTVDIETEIEDGSAPASAAGDLGPEGLAFATAAESPVDDPLVFVGHEVSGTTTIFRVVEDASGDDPTTGPVPGLARFDQDGSGLISFDDVLNAISAANNDEQIGGQNVVFQDVLAVIEAHNEETPVDS